MEPSGFNKLLTKKVPHIHEKILLSLDYEAFKNCHGVCKTWDELLIEESFLKKSYSVHRLAMDEELYINSAVGNLEKMEYLLLKGVNPNGNGKVGVGKNPLLLSIINHKKLAVKLLLSHGADPNVANKDGKSLLFYADQNDMVKILLHHGANPDTKEYSLLRRAAGPLGSKEIVETLLDGGANSNIANNWGSTPLHWAAMYGHGEVVETLLRGGAASNVANYRGSTSLHFAAEEGHKEVVEKLLDGGANPNVGDNQGQTPLHVAEIWGKEDVVKILEDAGAQN